MLHGLEALLELAKLLTSEKPRPMFHSTMVGDPKEERRARRWLFAFKVLVFMTFAALVGFIIWATSSR